MRLHTHATCSHIRAQQPRTVRCGLLTCLDILVGHILQHQRVGVSLEASLRGVGGNLVVEEEAPVVAVGHSQFAIGQSEPVEDAVLHLLIVVHQGVGLPLLFAIQALLKHLESQSGLTQLLHHHVLIGRVEEVVVLERIVLVEVLPLVEVGNGLVVVVRVDDRLVVLIGRMGIAVDGKLPQTFEPLRSQWVSRKEPQGDSQHICFPTILLCLRIASIARRDGTLQLVVALSSQQVVDVVFLLSCESLPLEISRVSHRHRPQR